MYEQPFPFLGETNFLQHDIAEEEKRGKMTEIERAAIPRKVLCKIAPRRGSALIFKHQAREREREDGERDRRLVGELRRDDVICSFLPLFLFSSDAPRRCRAKERHKVRRDLFPSSHLLSPSLLTLISLIGTFCERRSSSADYGLCCRTAHCKISVSTKGKEKHRE
jgi:hypothetical protein